MNHTTIGDIVRGDREVFPPYLYEAYQSTRRRAPMLPLVEVPLTLSELTGPGPAISAITPQDADLTRNTGTGGEAIGQRIIVTGRVLDERGTPVPHTLLEIWQANAAGRYLHKRDQWPADRSKLSGHGSLCDQSRGGLSLPDHSSGSLSLAQSPECLATSPYPFLGVRSLSALAPGDADVLSRRPTARARSHLQWRANRAGTTAPA